MLVSTITFLLVFASLYSYFNVQAILKKFQELSGQFTYVEGIKSDFRQYCADVEKQFGAHIEKINSIERKIMDLERELKRLTIIVTTRPNDAARKAIEEFTRNS
jgi:sensor histidine kinase YesM